jgi:chromosome segregation ATPase
MSTTNINNTVTRFNPDYILDKLYDFDERLGGNLREEAEEESKRDQFNLKTADIRKLFNEVKKQQAERNKVRLNEGRNHKMMTLESAINDQLAMAEKDIDEAVKILREQNKEGKHDKNNLKQKEEAIDGLKKMLKNFKERELESKKIKSVHDIAKDSGLDIRTVDMSNVARAEQRNLSKAEKDFLDRVKAENEELDSIMKEADTAMDQLLTGIDEIGENLDTQGKQIKRFDKKVSKLETNLEKSNTRLKQTVGKFRSATSVAMDILLIIILMIMIGVLIKVLSADK